MKAIVIALDNGTAYLQRLAPETASEAPLTDQEEVIIELYHKLQEAKIELKGKNEMPDDEWELMADLGKLSKGTYFPVQKFTL